MLHFPDSSTILPLLFSLMFFVCCWNGVSGIRGCQGVKYTHVKESPLIPRTPKAISCHIQTCTIRTDCWSREILSGYRVQCRLRADIRTHLRNQRRCDIPHFIVAQGRKAALRARQGVLYWEWFATGTLNGDIRWNPAISQGNGVMESGLMKGKSMLLDREGREPARGPFFCCQVDSALEVLG